MVFGICFDVKRDNLKEDKEFEGSIWQKLAYSKYICPKCKAHLKESMGELICLNGCHLPSQWMDDFRKQIGKIIDKHKKKSST